MWFGIINGDLAMDDLMDDASDLLFETLFVVIILDCRFIMEFA